ncbi:MAG: hypothetical protein OEO83_10125 [Alphaproteobacteria bacterium]|nr:hypothetical protein [Alphaproteobacteria bacterium]
MRFYGPKPPIAEAYTQFPVPIARIDPLSPEDAQRGYESLKDPANIKTYGERDKAYPSAVCYYRAPFLAETAAAVAAHIRPLLPFDIVETYWYARLYGTGDKLGIHVDRGACFVSVSVCFGYDFNDLFPAGSAWALGALNDTAPGEPREIVLDLQPGEGMLYPGCLAPHWRDVFLGELCGQAFFHYVPDDPGVFGEFFHDQGTRAPG